MNVILFSADINIIHEWMCKEALSNAVYCSDALSLLNIINKNQDSIVIADYDSVASELNAIMASGTNFQKLIVLEKSPEIITGKSLIFRGIKAYGNSRMLLPHLNQMLKTVEQGDIWSYPELTTSLANSNNKSLLNKDALELIEHRLSKKEQEVVYLILDGLTNDAIAAMLNITPRTIKAHIGSIFSKLHINDRLSLVLLLKS